MALEPQKHVSHESGETLMAHGPHVLHEYLTTKLEAALGKALPQMELRFSNLSLSADIVVAEDDSSLSKSELPTLPNTIKKLFVSTKKNQVRKEILKNVSGAFRPGTITLLLGQPSSGKSSLLKILSGRFPVEKNITLKGDITYNGVPQQEIGKTLPQFTAYVDQRDKHFPVLTVKETLEFAHTFCGGELSRRGEELLSKGTTAENVAALEATRAMFAHYPDVIIQQLGLRNCQDTVVGDTMLRGVSGGERKRVTTGEMEFGMKYVTLMDEVSTGLDSAATYDIINTQRSIAKTFRKTVVIALLQPSPEVFALFDDVMIMNEGEVMYHGPRDQVVDYFQDLGFVCPPRRDVADFLLDLGTKQQSMYEVDALNKRAKQTVPRYASEFAEVFRNSSIHAKTLQALDELHGPELLATVGDHMNFMPEFHQSFWGNTATLLRRQLLVQFRNIPFIAGRTVMIIIMGILYSTTFYKFDPTQVQVVMGVTFAGVLFLSMGQFPQVPTFFPAREVFYKQRKANFYRTSSYVLANVASQIPIVIAETVMFGSLVYWLCGFASSAAEFLVFEAVLLLVNLVFSTWFFFIASASPDNNIATPLSMVSLIFCIMFSGFFILKSQIPDYFIWVYWINPLSWSLRALAVNQYRSSEFDVCEYEGIDYCAVNNGQTMGEYYLGLFDTGSEKYWVPYAMIVMVVLYVLLIVLSYLVLEYKRYEAPQNVIVSKKDQSEPEDQYALAVTPKNNADALIAEEITMEVEPRETNFIPVTLAFKDLRYTVPLPSNPKESIDLLKGITGYALPGTITALMGSSGAGKTTLMDVIASRKTGGQVQGEILLNGYQANDLTIRRSTGYCEQMDIHSDASTIREALTFSAFLRQDSAVPASTKFDSVNECLDLLDMHDIADQIIRGRSVEQMKRLTIGVELAAHPSVLFLDEPTSGLDARSAKLIMDGVRKVADTGRTVVCTIHQPSSEVFFLFDSLLLLKRGGETVYFGPLGDKCRNLIDYFEAIPGVAPLPVGYNPATWMLECIGAGVDNTASSDAVKTDFVQVFNNSEQKRILEVTMARPGVTAPAPYSPELVFDNKRAANTALQLQFVIGRFFKLYWRTPTYNLTRFGISVLLALLFGVIFVDADYATYQGLNSGVGMMFIVIVFKGFLSFTTAIPVMSKERPSFYRERASQTYNAFWYFMGATLVELPYVFSSSLVFTLIFFPMVGFTGFGTAVLFWLNLSLMILMQTYMGQLFAFLLPSEEVATIVGVLVINILFLFMGFSPPASTIPSGYKWLYDIAPLRFPLSIAAALVFADCSELPTFDEPLGKYVDVGSQLGCQPLANAPVNLGHMTVKEFTEGVFGMKHANITSYFFVLIGFVIGFRILGALAIRYVNHQKK